MRKLPLLLLGLAIALATERADPAHAADPLRCLSPDQRRAAIVNKQAVPLAPTIRALKGRLSGEVVRARLCEDGNRLVYLLTVLARDGKVTRATIDGATGDLLDKR